MDETERAPGRFAAWLVFFAVLGAIGLGVGVLGLAVVSIGYSQRYAGRVFPGIHVYGADLSGMTLDEATATLEAAFPDPATLPLVVRSGDRVWQRSWIDLGLRFDPSATARVAYQVGRAGMLREQYETQLRAHLNGWALSPVVILPSTVQARAALRALAPEVIVPAIDASLLIEPDGITPLPAQAGRELDVEETVSVLPHAFVFGSEGLAMEMLTRQVEPLISIPGPAQTRAEALLANPLTLVGADKLTGFAGTWTLQPSEMARWLAVETVKEDGGARLAVTIQEEAIRASLGALNEGMPDEVAIDVGSTLPAVRAAMESGQSQATARLTHPRRNYTVLYGDTLIAIARAHGFPVWRIIEANPDIDHQDLRPGQQITLPSVDVLYPLSLVFEQRIVVDISDQRLYAYEGEVLVFDFIASTGIESSPTITGTFQVLNKEDEAYASSWDLWMPDFIGVYRSGPDFTNGIHGLPTLSNGNRLWEGNLGRPCSFGCIILGLDEAAALFEWAELGALVVIQD